MQPSNHEAFSGKIILLASTKPPWTNTPDNFEHVADHLTSPAMNFRPVILKKNTVIHLAVKSIPFVLKSYRKMSLLDNQYDLPWLESRYATI